MALPKGRLYLRGKTYWMRYTYRGQEIRTSCETTDEREARNKMEVAMAKLHLTGMVAPKDVKLESLVQDYLAFMAATDKGGVAKRGESYWCLHLQPWFQKVKIGSLTSQDYVRYRKARVDEGASQTTVNRELQILIAAFKHGYRSTPPTVERIPYIKLTSEKNNARKTFVSEEQQEALLAAASREGLHWRVLLEMAFMLGWRRGEMLGLRIRQVDVVERVVRLDKTKNDDPRECPLTERLSLLLQQLISGRDPEERVFRAITNGGGNFNRVWKRIRANAGCPKVLMHDWRRTSARSKRNAGVPESIVMDIQGWKTSAMFRRYAIVDNADKRKALELIEKSSSPHNNPHNQA